MRNLEVAIPLFEDALRMARTQGDRISEVNQLANLGAAYLELQCPEKSLEYLEQAQWVGAEINGHGLEDHLANQSSAYRFLGEDEKAEKCFEMSAAVARERSRPITEISAYQHLGELFEAKKTICQGGSAS